MVRAGCFELCDGSGGKLMSLFTPSLVAMSINGSFELGNGLDNLLSLVSPGCFVLANKLANPLLLVFAGCFILAGCSELAV